MTRAFDGTELDEDLLVQLCEEAMRAPTAGHVRGVRAVVLAGRQGVRDYLDTSCDAEWLASSSMAPGLAKAGGIVVVVCDPGAYASRYAEADKAGSGLDLIEAWPVPYWHGDAAFATMALLLLAEDAGIAACFMGVFQHDDEILALINAPLGTLLFGVVFLGHAAAEQERSGSLDRSGPTRSERVARCRF
jgi:nitroreductase